MMILLPNDKTSNSSSSTASPLNMNLNMNVNANIPNMNNLNGGNGNGVPHQMNLQAGLNNSESNSQTMSLQTLKMLLAVQNQQNFQTALNNNADNNVFAAASSMGMVNGGTQANTNNMIANFLLQQQQQHQQQQQQQQLQQAFMLQAATSPFHHEQTTTSDTGVGQKRKLSQLLDSLLVGNSIESKKKVKQEFTNNNNVSGGMQTNVQSTPLLNYEELLRQQVLLNNFQMKETPIANQQIMVQPQLFHAPTPTVAGTTSTTQTTMNQQTQQPQQVFMFYPQPVQMYNPATGMNITGQINMNSVAPTTANAAPGGESNPPAKKRQRNSVKSTFRGVSWHRRDRRWLARLWHENKLHYIGSFVNEADAARAVDRKEIELRGRDLARLNFPQEFPINKGQPTGSPSSSTDADDE